MNPTKRYEAIFQIFDGKWMDYDRQTVHQPDAAISGIRARQSHTGKAFRARVEDWSDSQCDPDIYYGDWDKTKLSPSAQHNGVFKLIG